MKRSQYVQETRAWRLLRHSRLTSPDTIETVKEHRRVFNLSLRDAVCSLARKVRAAKRAH